MKKELFGERKVRMEKEIIERLHTPEAQGGPGDRQGGPEEHRRQDFTRDQ